MLPLLLAAALGLADPAPVTPGPTKVTILYDAFGGGPGLERDWGFSALIEYQGKRILFDTGNNAEIFARNAQRLHADLTHLDFVVISHRHTDHTAGLSAVLRANPRVPIYAPQEGFGIFGAAVPGTFYRTLPALPDSMRYFDGVVPKEIRAGTLWPGASIVLVDSSLTIAPGIRLLSLVSETPGTRELRELSLLLTTPEGDIRGTSDTPVRILFGGLHLVAAPDSVLEPLAHRLHSDWHVLQIAPGHCTGEPAFAILQREFGLDYRYAGLGRQLVVQ
jgi:7,8-dihydropterin-6-yl-methyl-4-(beta-D-ribofuranosyl)aminobenzene 5'-phosphate synthase